MKAVTESRPTVVLYTADQAATYLGLARSTLNKWRCQGEGPIFIKMGGAVRYRKVDLEGFMDRRSSISTTNY